MIPRPLVTGPSAWIGAELAKLCTPWVGTLLHFKGMKSPPQYPLAMERAFWVGHPVVAVLADTRAQAEDAADGVAFADANERELQQRLARVIPYFRDNSRGALALACAAMVVAAATEPARPAA